MPADRIKRKTANMFMFCAHLLTPTLLIAVLPSILSLPYPVYGVKSYRRSVPVKNQLSYYQPSPQYDDQPTDSRFPSPSHRQSYPSDDNYFLNDGVGYRDPQSYQSFGKPTYSGEYRPKQYYYAHGPKYNSFEERLENSNPLDYLHEEMFQEEQRERQNSWPTGMEQWFQNNGQPKSLTDEFLKNLVVYNGKAAADQDYEREPEREVEPLSDYDDEDLYYGGQNFETYDQMASQLSPAQEFHQRPATANRYDAPAMQKPRHDADELQLKSLRKHVQKDDEHFKESSDEFNANSHKGDAAAYNGYDPEFDYDDDAWINWDRKRSGATAENANRGASPLKALEVQLMAAIQSQKLENQKHATTKGTVAPTGAVLTPTDAESGLLKLKASKSAGGQKEIVLQQPAAPIRRAGFDPSAARFVKSSSHRTAKEVRSCSRSP